MTFNDLPPGWAERNVTDPDIFADAVDLFATLDSREQGCLYLLVCDHGGQVLQPVAIDQWNFDETPMEQRRILEMLLGQVAAVGARHLVAIIARRGHPASTGNDHQLAHLLREVTTGHGIALDGLAIATPLGVRAHAGAELPGQRATA